MIDRCPIDTKNRFYALEALKQRTSEALTSQSMPVCEDDYKSDVQEKSLIPQRTHSHSSKLSTSSTCTAYTSDDKTMSLETNMLPLTSESSDYFNYSESIESCSISVSSMLDSVHSIQSNTVRIASDITTSDGRTLKQVPGHSYLYYQEDHPTIQTIFDEILQRKV